MQLGNEKSLRRFRTSFYWSENPGGWFSCVSCEGSNENMCSPSKYKIHSNIGRSLSDRV